MPVAAVLIVFAILGVLVVTVGYTRAHTLYQPGRQRAVQWKALRHRQARRLRVVTLSTLAVGAVLMFPIASVQASSTWTVQRTPTIPNGDLSAVSCTAATQCEAVGAAVEGWNGTKWSIQPVPAGASFGSSV
jgi:hypothetical protein